MFDNRKSERYYPFVLPLLAVIIYHAYAMQTPDNLIVQKFPDWLNISITLSGIALGFLGTMIGAVLSITSSTVMDFIYSQKVDHLLMQYIRGAAVINLLVLLFSIALLVTSSTPIVPPIWLLYPWLYFFCSSFLCSYRIIHLLFMLLGAVNNENRAKHQKRKVYSPEPEKLSAPKTD